MKSATALPSLPTQSHNAIVVKMKNTNSDEQDATTVGHVPDSLAEVLYIYTIARKGNQDDLLSI